MMGSGTPSIHSTARGIDIHHHYLPPAFVDVLAESGHPAAAKAEAVAWSAEKSLAMMDASGIETAIVSLSLPGASFSGASDPAASFSGAPDPAASFSGAPDPAASFSGAPDPVALARQCNEYAAGLVARFPGRFGAFASLPLLDAQAAMGEIAYALDTLNLDGVMLLSNVRGRYLGHPEFDALLAELNRRKAIVFLHPNQPPGPGFNDFVEFPHEVTRALASLTESGAIEHYRRIRYILAYGGGTIPFIASRVTVVGMDVMGSFLKTMIHFFQRVRTMQRMNYDLTASTDPIAWRALYGHTKSTRILMGSNYPWTSPGAFARQQAELRAFEDLDQSEIESVERGNSLRLLPRFA
jgi:predicted TIM-barrel fold metal-dependent hydrolase